MDLNIVTQTILACLAVGTLMGAGLTCRAMRRHCSDGLISRHHFDQAGASHPPIWE